MTNEASSVSKVIDEELIEEMNPDPESDLVILIG